MNCFKILFLSWWQLRFKRFRDWTLLENSIYAVWEINSELFGSGLQSSWSNLCFCLHFSWSKFSSVSLSLPRGPQLNSAWQTIWGILPSLNKIDYRFCMMLPWDKEFSCICLPEIKRLARYILHCKVHCLAFNAEQGSSI